jgi:hypothetical protein
MKAMDCQNLRREIDEATPGESLSLFASRHVSGCAECKTLSEQHQKLQNILSNLGTIEAPGDFDFRLRARLARERANGARFQLSGLSFGVRSAMVAALILMFGSVVFLSFRNSRNNSLTAGKTEPATVESPKAVTAAPPDVNQVATVGPSVSAQPDSSAPVKVRNGRNSGLAVARNSPRFGSREMGSTPATVIKASDLNAQNGFPIEATMQPVRVSLDNGRGSARTISLPPVSFGSQRVLAQGATPLMASSRGSW